MHREPPHIRICGPLYSEVVSPSDRREPIPSILHVLPACAISQTFRSEIMKISMPTSYLNSAITPTPRYSPRPKQQQRPQNYPWFPLSRCPVLLVHGLVVGHVPLLTKKPVPGAQAGWCQVWYQTDGTVCTGIPAPSRPVIGSLRY